MVSGWGSNQPGQGPDSNFLNARSVGVVACAPTDYFNVSAQHLCAEAAICTTDIGGPLTFNNELVGIAAWHDPLVCGTGQVSANASVDKFVLIFAFLGLLREDHDLQDLDFVEYQLRMLK
jgi:hypothetical protein